MEKSEYIKKMKKICTLSNLKERNLYFVKFYAKKICIYLIVGRSGQD